MKLYGSPFSPYARKARVLIIEKNIKCPFVEEDRKSTRLNSSHT